MPDEERTPLVVLVLEILQLQQEHIQELRDEIAGMKGQKLKPPIKPSKLEKKSENNEQQSSPGKRPGSTKREKTKELRIHETVTLPAENVPKGSVRKGYEEFTVQGIRFRLHNKLYRRERRLAPDGRTFVAPLPEDVVFVGGHFDADPVCFVLVQYYHCHVTQPLILEQLLELGVGSTFGGTDMDSHRV
ncbi:MAG: hypothetical protein V2B18_19485 [Pseudomonadota bacterium]